MSMVKHRVRNPLVHQKSFSFYLKRETSAVAQLSSLAHIYGFGFDSDVSSRTNFTLTGISQEGVPAESEKMAQPITYCYTGAVVL